jgi:RHS repeat-associated protein
MTALAEKESCTGDSPYRSHDALGSVRAITDSTGIVVAHYEYSAWGELLPSSSDLAVGFNYRFAGSLGVRWDETLGFYYARQRWYDRTLQRFISRDLLRSANRYAYCNNSPCDLVDPTGLAPIPWGGATNFGDSAGYQKWLQSAYDRLLAILSDVDRLNDFQGKSGCGCDLKSYASEIKDLLNDPTVNIQLSPKGHREVSYVDPKNPNTINLSFLEFQINQEKGNPLYLTYYQQELYLAYTLLHELGHIRQLRKLNGGQPLTDQQCQQQFSTGEQRHPRDIFQTIQNFFQSIDPTINQLYWQYKD